MRSRWLAARVGWVTIAIRPVFCTTSLSDSWLKSPASMMADGYGRDFNNTCFDETCWCICDIQRTRWVVERTNKRISKFQHAPTAVQSYCCRLLASMSKGSAAISVVRRRQLHLLCDQTYRGGGPSAVWPCPLPRKCFYFLSEHGEFWCILGGASTLYVI